MKAAILLLTLALVTLTFSQTMPSMDMMTNGTKDGQKMFADSLNAIQGKGDKDKDSTGSPLAAFFPDNLGR
ncbi:hypothetical protein HDE_07675 [Halotydeus destructor]|nr:hypothetical protein HDE_07675 [Halotydeus destructor]